MSSEPATCSLCGQELADREGEERVLTLQATGEDAAVCAQCYGAIGDGGDDEFLEFLLS